MNARRLMLIPSPPLTLSGVLCAVLFTLTTLITSAVHADQSCSRVDAYWETNLTKLRENLRECDFQSWQKCSQAAAIHYDLNTGSLFHRAQVCGLAKPVTPGADYTDPKESDSKQCLAARDTLRKVFEDRAQARLACAAARAGGENQEWLDSQCTLYRSRMANYHMPFRNMTQSCEVNYEETIAWKD